LSDEKLAFEAFGLCQGKSKWESLAPMPFCPRVEKRKKKIPLKNSLLTAMFDFLNAINSS